MRNFYKKLPEQKGFYPLYESFTAPSQIMNFIEDDATEKNLKLTLNMCICFRVAWI